MKRTVKIKSMEERFWKKVNKNGPIHADLKTKCWLWTASTCKKGYGRIGISRSNKYKSTHRYSWELFNGKIPKDTEVCHQCDNPKCVNPYHLFLGTHLDNMRDSIHKGRSTRCEKHGGAKLTALDVIKIRESWDVNSSRGQLTRLAKEYNVVIETIRKIVYRIHWKEV